MMVPRADQEMFIIFKHLASCPRFLPYFILFVLSVLMDERIWTSTLAHCNSVIGRDVPNSIINLVSSFANISF